MTDATSAPAPVRRCHACGAVRPPTAQWCLQCYTAFDPPQPALGPQEPERSPTAGTATDDVDDPVRPAAGEDEPAADGDDAPPADREELDARAEQMLARLSQEGSARPGGRLGDLSSSRGTKVALAIGGAVALTLVLVALMAGLGALL